MKDCKQYNRNHKVTIIAACLFLLFLSSSSLFAQKWSSALSFTSPGKEAIGALAGDPFQNTYLSGTFDNELVINGQSLITQGFDDVFLSKIDVDGQVEWTIAGGGSNFDQVSALAVDRNDDIIWGGQFWIEGQFEGITLPLVHDSRGIYLLKYNAQGILTWGRTIEGDGLKILTDIITDTQNNIYLTGYFENTLLLESTTLSGNGFQNLFLLKLNAEGELLWARSAGEVGEVRPQALALNNEEGVYVSGAFKGEVAFAEDSIQTNTEDRDIFVASYDADGTPLWGRKAGGVYDDRTEALAVTNNGDLYLTGVFLGVLRFGQNLEIQTDGFNENFFLASYDSEGTPLMAKSYGSTEDEAGYDLLIEDNQIYLTGNYFGNLSIAPFTISGNEDYFNGFLAAFDLNGNISWLEGFKSSVYIEGNRLISHGSERLLLAGNFATDATLGYLRLDGAGGNDIFLAEINPLLSSSTSPEHSLENSKFKIFPNPGQGPFTFSWEPSIATTPTHLSIYNLTGQLLHETKIFTEQDAVSWNPVGISDGVYFYKIKNAQNVLSQGKLILSR